MTGEPIHLVAEIFGVLRRPGGRQRIEVTLPYAATSRELFAAMGFTESECTVLQASLAGRILAPGEALPDGALLTVFAPMGGG